MIKAVISGDIIASTSLTDAGRELLENAIKEILGVLEQKFNTYSRRIKGDYIECVVPNPEDALRVALIIKSFIKSISIEKTTLYKDKKRVK